MRFDRLYSLFSPTSQTVKVFKHVKMVKSAPIHVIRSISTDKDDTTSDIEKPRTIQKEQFMIYNDIILKFAHIIVFHVILFPPQG